MRSDTFTFTPITGGCSTVRTRPRPRAPTHTTAPPRPSGTSPMAQHPTTPIGGMQRHLFARLHAATECCATPHRSSCSAPHRTPHWVPTGRCLPARFPFSSSCQEKRKAVIWQALQRTRRGQDGGNASWLGQLSCTQWSPSWIHASIRLSLCPSLCHPGDAHSGYN